MTLTELERRLGGAGYLAALRSARYGATASAPTPEQRRAFRRELAAGLGWRGRRARLVGAAAYAAVTTRSRPARLAW